MRSQLSCWELFKGKRKLIIVAYSQNKAARTRAEKRALEETLFILIRKENLGSGLFASGIRECKVKLLLISGEGISRCNGPMSAAFLALRGRAGKYFSELKVEPHWVQQNIIATYRDKIVSEQSDIEKELVDMFSELLSERKHTDETTLEKLLQVMPGIPRDVFEKNKWGNYRCRNRSRD